MPGGPPRRPTKLKVLDGITRPSRLNLHEPIPRDVAPTPPEGATGEVLVEWNRVVEELTAMGIAHAADRDVIYAYCCAVIEHRDAFEAYSREGALVPGQRGGTLVRNPAAQIMRDAALAIRAFARELGLSPAARASLKMPERDQRDHAARILS
jgi:P27 family predicted phage terminase small subunit